VTEDDTIIVTLLLKGLVLSQSLRAASDMTKRVTSLIRHNGEMYRLIQRYMKTSKARVRELRKLAAKRRVQNLLINLKNQGQHEVLRETRRLARSHARNQIRQILPFY
jgi:hypothetical protein